MAEDECKIDEEKLHERLMIYSKALDMGGVLWTEPQVEFLKLLCEALGNSWAFDTAVMKYNAPPKDDPNVAQVLPNLTIRFLGEDEEEKKC